MTDRTKAIALGALLVVWIALVLTYVVMEPDPQRVPLTYKTGHVPKQAHQASALKRPLLAKSRQTVLPPQNIKNIFAPLDRGDAGGLERKEAADVAAAAAAAEARRAKRLAKKPPPHVVQAAVPTPPPPPPVVPPPPAQTAAQKAGLELGEYRFLGYLVKHGESMAFLEKGHEIYIVKAGDVVNRAVQVKTIDPGFVKLVDARTAVEATIPLTKGTAGAS
jgi:hypothetical protein